MIDDSNTQNGNSENWQWNMINRLKLVLRQALFIRMNGVLNLSKKIWKS